MEAAGMNNHASWTRHDTHARHDPKCQALIQRGSMAAYGRWWVIVELLREQEDYRLRLEDWILDVLATELCLDRAGVGAFLEELVFLGLLQRDDHDIWSPSLLRRMQAYDERMKALSDAGRNAAAMRWHKGADATAMQSRVDKSRVDRSRKEKKKTPPVPKVQYAPEVLLTEEEYAELVKRYGKAEAQRCIDKLSAYKGSSGKKYKSDYLAIHSWVREAVGVTDKVAKAAASGWKCKKCGRLNTHTGGTCLSCREDRDG
jgi:hypothetical protein